MESYWTHASVQRRAVELIGGQQAAYFQQEVPRDVIAEIVRLVMRCYDWSGRFAEQRWGRPEERDALAVLRRAEIETQLTALRAKFRERVGVHKVLNSRRTASHTEIYCGGVVLTQSKVEDERGPIREAHFRRTLAKRSQLNLRLFGDVPDPSEEAIWLWACVVHQPSDDVRRPAFLRVAFPYEDGEWENSLNLFELVPEALTPERRIEIPTQPILRPILPLSEEEREAR
jgi:hypothetical protein